MIGAWRSRRIAQHAGLSAWLSRLHGSVDKEGVLELGLIGRGMRRMFLLNEHRPVTTSRVLRVHVDQPKVVQPNSSPSIH